MHALIRPLLAPRCSESRAWAVAAAGPKRLTGSRRASIVLGLHRLVEGGWMTSMRPRRALAAAGLAAAALALPSLATGTGGPGEGASPPTFVVVPPGQTWAGKSYVDLAGAWWKWAAQIPTTLSPVSDRNGFLCRIGQPGTFFFLAQSAGGAPVTRTCTVPAGRAIFFPVITLRCSARGAGDIRLNTCAKDSVNRVNFVQVDVD